VNAHTVITAIVCAIAGGYLLHRQERRHDREMLRAEERWRLAAWQQVNPIPPPGHPDWETALSDGERDELDRIAARWDDTGLGILGSEGERP
jgi:hypothetical protein